MQFLYYNKDLFKNIKALSLSIILINNIGSNKDINDEAFN